MTTITLHYGDGMLAGADLDRLIHLGNDAPPIRLGMLPDGMSSGKPSVAIAITLEDGRVVLAETSYALLKAAINFFDAHLALDRRGV